MRPAGLAIEMIGHAEHEQIGTVVGRDVVATEAELREVILVFDEGSDLGGQKIFHAGQNVKTRSKGGFRSEITPGNIAHIEADTKTGIGFHFILITGHPNQRIEGQGMHKEVGPRNPSRQCGIADVGQTLLLDAGRGAVGVNFEAQPIIAAVVEEMPDLATVIEIFVEFDVSRVRGVRVAT